MKRLFIIVFMLCFFGSFLASQENMDQISKELKLLDNRLKEVYGQIYDIKQEMEQKGANEELNKKLEMLSQEAKEIHKRVQALQMEKAGKKIEKKGFPEEKPKYIEEKPKYPELPKTKKYEYPISENKDVDNKIKQKKKELKKIEKQISQSSPEQREYLELYKFKIMEELQNLKRNQHKNKKQNPWEKNKKQNPWDNQYKKQNPWEKNKKQNPWDNQYKKQPPWDRNKKQNPWGNNNKRKFKHENPQQIFKKFKKEFPDEYKELMKLKRENPREFFRRMKRLIPEYKKLKEMKEKDPEYYKTLLKQREMENKVKKLSLDIRNSMGEDRGKKISELKSLLMELFSLREVERDKHIQRLEKELQKMKEIKSKRQENKDIIIDRKLKQLIGEGEEWEW